MAASPATPSALYKMLSIPDAQELILRESELLPAVEVPMAQALHHTLAADVLAPEPVPGFRASIKVREPSTAAAATGKAGATGEAGAPRRARPHQLLL